jgi:hypothetical protein
MVEDTGFESYGFEITLNGMISLLSIMKIYQLVQNLLAGTHGESTFLFKERRLK